MVIEVLDLSSTVVLAILECAGVEEVVSNFSINSNRLSFRNGHLKRAARDN